MPTPTEPVRRFCYADDLTVWATGVNIPDMDDILNSYLEEITAYLKDTSLLISWVTLFSPDIHQTKTHPRILIEDSRLPLVQCPKILGVYMDTSLSFNKHSSHVAERVSGRNNILKALAGTSWGQQKETLLMTYKAVGRSIINYAAPVWSTNIRDTNYRNIKYTQNQSLMISTGCFKMSSVDHLYMEASMLKVKEHSELLSAQYLARCLEPENVNFSITAREPPKRMHRSAVEPLMIAKDRKTTLQAIHTMAVNQAVTSLGRNVVLDDRPPAINISEKELTRKERTTLSQLRPRIVDSLAYTRAESVRMLASTSAPTAARHHTMLSISSMMIKLKRGPCTARSTVLAAPPALVKTRVNKEARLQTTQPTSGGAVTVVTNCCENCVEPSRPVFGASRPCGIAGRLALLTKAGDVETNPGPTTLNKLVWICDICYKPIHVSKQISIRCNRIEHWVHLRCAGIRQAQYTDTWNCHLYR